MPEQKKKGKGGARDGAGRKPKVDEDKVVNQSIAAIQTKYGSVEKGLVSLLNSGEASLIKFVFEHAIGKPKDKIEHSGKVESGVIFILDERFKESKDNPGIST